MPVQTTNIAWCDDSANHWVGCAKVSEGCARCWAADVAARFDRTPEPWTVANIDVNLTVYDEGIAATLERRRPGWCFFPSSSDPFLPWLPWHAADAYLDALHRADHMCFQVLTKWGPERQRARQDARPEEYEPEPVPWLSMPDNAMLGVTVESELREYRLDWLREQDAAVKFVSFEPLLEILWDVDLSGIDWAIIGGESGDDRRYWHPRFARELVAQCREQDVAVFFKQHGDRFPEERIKLDGRRYREFPNVPERLPPAPAEYVCTDCGEKTGHPYPTGDGDPTYCPRHARERAIISGPE